MIIDIAETQVAENSIVGVEFKPLKSFPDDRGFFRELVRKTDGFFFDTLPGTPDEIPFSQLSHSKMGKNTVKAWHFHHRQIDWWYCPLGVIHVVLFDLREESPTYQRKLEFKLGDAELDKEVITTVVRIPQGVAHGCKVLTDSAHLFYITSQCYDPEDEGRHPFNSNLVPHSWGAEELLTVAPNDKRTHIPKYERVSAR